MLFTYYNIIIKQEIFMMVKAKIIGLLTAISRVLPVFFWLFLIFGFEEPAVAVASVLAASIHEIGHIACILIKKGSFRIKGVLSGFRIAQKESLSYEDEMLIYFGGPAINLIAALLSAFFIPVFREYAFCFSLINLVTALSNLIPIKGYDGYGILRAYIRKNEYDEAVLCIPERISFAITFLLCIFSLYLIDRVGGGYWIFAVFFLSMINCIKDGIEKRLNFEK